MTELSVAAPAGHTRLERKLNQALLVLLGVFLFTLPLVEAPKNIAVGLYLAVWCVRAAVTSDFGGRWDRFDTAFACMLASAMVSAYSGYVTDLSGVGRLLVMAWVVKRTRFTERDARLLLGVACAGLLAGLALGVARLLTTPRSFLELPSVGHANQSALYITILALAGFGWWRQGRRAWPRGWTTRALLASGALFGFALVASASRAAIIAALAGVVLMLLLVRNRTRPLRTTRVVLGCAFVAGLVGASLYGLGKLAPDLAAGKFSEDLVTPVSVNKRVMHWRLAIEGWRERPLIGFGPDSFQQITVERACEWVAARGEKCNPSDYEESSHAHSLYFATLAERGLLGVLALGILLAAWGHALLRTSRTAVSAPLWVLSAAGFIVVMVGGVFNTTLRVEHGSLALLGLALWLAAGGRADAKT